MGWCRSPGHDRHWGEGDVRMESKVTALVLGVFQETEGEVTARDLGGDRVVPELPVALGLPVSAPGPAPLCRWPQGEGSRRYPVPWVQQMASALCGGSRHRALSRRPEPCPSPALAATVVYRLIVRNSCLCSCPERAKSEVEEGFCVLKPCLFTCLKNNVRYETSVFNYMLKRTH